MKKLSAKAVLLTGATLALVSYSGTAMAATCNGLKDANGNDVNTSVDLHCTGSDTYGGIASIILWVINMLAIGVGIAVVIGIVIGGITYASSDGDAGKAKQGKDIIMNAIIGLFLFLFLFAIVNFMIPGGLFSSSPTGYLPASGTGAMGQA